MIDQQRDEQQNEGHVRADLGASRVDVGINAVGDEQQGRRYNSHVNNTLQRVNSAIEIGTLLCGRLNRAR
jgi:hypothetical protein